MSFFPSSPNLNDEHAKGSVRFKWDGAKWKRLGQSFDTTSIANTVAQVLSENSYSGHLETVEDKTYTIDVKTVSDRTITEFYTIAATGSCSARLVGGGETVGTISVSSTGATASLSNTSLSAGDQIDMVITGNSSCEDLKFVVGYSV